jgi:hypothetical protein
MLWLWALFAAADVAGAKSDTYAAATKHVADTTAKYEAAHHAAADAVNTYTEHMTEAIDVGGFRDSNRHVIGFHVMPN